MNVEKLLERFSFRLRRWQVQKVADFLSCILEERPYRKGIIAPLGAGKTLFGLVLASMVGAENTLIVCPTFLKREWESESAKFGFFPPECTTYESAKKLGERQYKLLILDEVLKIKNPEAQRTKDVRRLCREAKHVIGLTGTPISGKEYLDMRWVNSIVSVLPENEVRFKLKYGKCVYAEHPLPNGQKGKHLEVEEWYVEKLNEDTKSVVEVVDSAELMQDVPEKIYRTVAVPMPPQYYKSISGHYAKNRSKAVMQARTITDGFIYQDSGEAIRTQENLKLKALKKEIREFREKGVESFVIFSAWKESRKILEEEFQKECCVLDGEATENEQNLALELFISGEKKILLASANFAEGMNLQYICHVCFYFSNSLSPMKRSQSEGRFYRPGQEKITHIIDFVCAGTLDEKLLFLLKNRGEMSERLIKKALEEELEEKIKGELSG